MKNSDSTRIAQAGINLFLTLTGSREQSGRERPLSFFGQLSFESRTFWRNQLGVQILREKDFVRKFSCSFSYMLVFGWIPDIVNFTVCAGHFNIPITILFFF